MEDMLWPARNVGEYAYCPRLFYLMEVEGIHLPSADTEQGVALHRRVDRPSADIEHQDRNSIDSDRPRSVRSLTLTSEMLGLTATLDLAEVQGTAATPVEYRKGRPHRPGSWSGPDDSGVQHEKGELSCRPEPWPTDRVQLGLQVLLLEEAGYQVNEGVLYYAAEKLRLSVPVDDALKMEAKATLDAARKCAQGPRPLPLVNDSRCPRCSLQPICLPDEVNHQRSLGNAASPRQMWPPRDDGLHIVAQREGTRIGISGMSLKVVGGDAASAREIPLANLESLALLGNVQISTQTIHALADRSIPVGFLSSAGRLVAMIDPLDSVSAEVRRAQVRVLDEPSRALELARALVAAKITNQRVLLQRNHPSLPAGVLDDMATRSAGGRCSRS